MSINVYDKDGRTPLMNAVIAGDLEEVKRLLELGADPDITDKAWGTTRAIDFASRLAKQSEEHKSIKAILAASSRYPENSFGRTPQPNVASSTNLSNEPHVDNYWPNETVRTRSGRIFIRLRSSVFYWGALVSFIGGVILLSNEMLIGGFLSFLLTPCLLLYPAVRYLIGGKDSVVAAVTTVIVEEVLKSELKKTVDKSSRRKRR